MRSLFLLLLVGTALFSLSLSFAEASPSSSSSSLTKKEDDLLQFAKAEQKLRDVNKAIDKIIATKKNKNNGKNSAVSNKKKTEVKKGIKVIESLDKKIKSADRKAKEALRLAEKERKLANIDAAAARSAPKSIRAARGKKSVVKNNNNNVITHDSFPSPLRRSSSPIPPYKPDRSEVNGLWRAGGPDGPYIPKRVMYTGIGVNRGAADVLRNWFGFKLSFRNRQWIDNHYLQDFSSDQFRYIARSKNGRLIIPPLSGPIPEMDAVVAARFRHFVTDGGNTIIVCGGPNSVIFLNSLLPVLGYDVDLNPRWRGGLYEKQTSAGSSRFAAAPVTVPADVAWGVDVATLPPTAVSYYESDGVSAVFAFKIKAGQLIYVGGTFAEKSPTWREILFAAAKTGLWERD